MTVPTTPLDEKAKPFFVRYRTRFGLLFSIAVFFCLLFIQPSWAKPEYYWPYGFVLHTMGYALILAGVLGRLWCTLYIGGRKERELQTTGPYSLVRHPLYVGSLLLGLGIVMLSQSPLVLLAGVVYFVAQYRATIRFEEAKLANIFGEQHAEYIKRVPCFIPKLSVFDPTPPGTVNLQPLQWEISRSIAYLATIPLLDLIYQLQTNHIIHTILFP